MTAMRVLFLLVIGLTWSAASRADPSTGTVTVETPLGVIDSMRGEPPDTSANAARLLNLSDIANADNYPDIAREREVHGKVRVRVSVGPEGLATHCETVGKPAPELGGPTCALFLAKARFDPARDRKGRAVKSIYTRTVAWVLEALVPLPFADFTDRIIFSFNADGSIANCQRETRGTRPAEADEKEPDPCSANALNAQMTVAMAGLDNPSHWELLAEQVVRTGAVDFWESIGNGEDEQLISRVGHRLVVNADGVIGDCTPIHPKEFEALYPLNCERVRRGKFVSAGEANRRVTILSIIYLRKRSPGPKTT